MSAKTIIHAELVTDADVSAGIGTGIVLRKTRAERIEGDVRSTAERLTEAFLRSKKPETIATYQKNLRAFAKFAGRGATLMDIRETLDKFLQMPGPLANQLVLEWQDDMERQGISTATAAQRLMTLRSMVNLGQTIGLCTFAIKIKQKKVMAARETVATTPEEYERVLVVLDQKAEEAQDRLDSKLMLYTKRAGALVSLLYESGLRRMEPLTIEYPVDVDLKGQRVRVLGKGRDAKEWFPISDHTKERINEWLEVRPGDEGPLFASNRSEREGQSINVREVNRILDWVSQLSGVKIKPHDLRRGAATELLNQSNGDIPMVTEFLRHRGYGTVMKYDKNRKNQPKKAVGLLDRKKNP